MCPKIRTSFLATMLVLCLISISISETDGQLNFSTGWGKRTSQKTRVEPSGAEDASRSGLSLEELLDLYSFVQMEARRISDCRKRHARLEGPPSSSMSAEYRPTDGKWTSRLRRVRSNGSST